MMLSRPRCTPAPGMPSFCTCHTASGWNSRRTASRSPELSVSKKWPTTFSLSVSYMLSLRPEAPGGAVTLDPPGGGVGEMAADDEEPAALGDIEHAPPRGAGERLVDVEIPVPVGLGALHRVMHDVARDDRIMPVR